MIKENYFEAAITRLSNETRDKDSWITSKEMQDKNYIIIAGAMMID